MAKCLVMQQMLLEKTVVQNISFTFALVMNFFFKLCVLWCLVSVLVYGGTSNGQDHFC